MNFEEAIAHILKFEGGYVCHESDPGGETNFGISKRAYPNIDISTITPNEAKLIYKRDYWDKIGVEKLPSSLRLLFFDAAVNQGPTSAVIMLQKVVGAKPDGVMGPATLEMVNAVKPNELVFRYFMARQACYMANPNFATFGLGWLKRLKDCTLESLKAVA